MSHYCSYLELVSQYNATCSPEHTLQALPYWPASFTIAHAHEELRYLYAQGGDAARLAILLGNRLGWSPSAAVAPSPLQAPPPSARAPAPDAPRPSSPRCVAADPMEVEPQAPAPAPASAERTRPLGAGGSAPPVAKRARVA